MEILHAVEEGVQDYPEEHLQIGGITAGGIQHRTVLGVLFESLGPSVLEQEPDDTL